nr:MAG TPA: hypothetical protein [Caudoviricetes sp.]
MCISKQFSKQVHYISYYFYHVDVYIKNVKC